MVFQEAASTRDRLLEAACSAFSEKGYRDATVAEICRKAGANVAAVNYYFGSKEALYKEAWGNAHSRVLNAFPPNGGVGPDAPAEQRLRGRIRALLQRALSAEDLEFRLMNQEIANPTGLLGQVIRDTIRPLGEAMARIVGELLGDHADEDTIRLCVTAVIGPCMQVMRKQRLHARQGRPLWFQADMLESMVGHFTAFALAGIRGIRRRLERRTPGKQAARRGNARKRPRGPL